MSDPANCQAAPDSPNRRSSQQQSPLQTISPATRGSQCYSTTPIQLCPPQASIQGSSGCHALPKQPPPETTDFTLPLQYNKDSDDNRLCCSSAPSLQMQSNTPRKMDLHSQKRPRVAEPQGEGYTEEPNFAHQPFHNPLFPSTTMQLSASGPDWASFDQGENHEYVDADSPPKSVLSQKMSTYPTPLTPFSVPTPREEQQSIGGFPTFQPDGTRKPCSDEILSETDYYWDSNMKDAMFAGTVAEPFVDNAFFSDDDPDANCLGTGWFELTGTDMVHSHHPCSTTYDEQLFSTHQDDPGSHWAYPSDRTGAHLQSAQPEAPDVSNLPTNINASAWNFYSDTSIHPVPEDVNTILPNSNVRGVLGSEYANNTYDPSLPVLESVEEVYPGVGNEALGGLYLNNPFAPPEQDIEACDTAVSEAVNRSRQNQRNAELDRQLVEWKRQGLSYKAIKERGGFQEAESTLRGRFRTLTKTRENRLRKPTWPKHAIDALINAVEHFTKSSNRQGLRGRNNTGDKIPWKKVAEWMVKERGCYRYGNATVKKKYQELLQSHHGLV